MFPRSRLPNDTEEMQATLKRAPLLHRIGTQLHRRRVGSPRGLLKSLALLCATPLCAAAEGELFEEHLAHEYGVATLEIAVDASRLALQFSSPAMNLLGFEHPLPARLCVQSVRN